MSTRLDPEVAAALQRLAATGPAPVVARGDWRTLRTNGNQAQRGMAALTPAVAGVGHTFYEVRTADGAALELRWYQREGEQPGSAAVYAHGGGQVLGTLDAYDGLLDWYTCHSGVPMLSVAYRLAPESNGTTLSEDVFAALSWLHEHAEELGVDPERIAVMGDSGGGAPTAGAAILARDRGLKIARQILIYPMLDDRNVEPDPQLVPYATWDYDANWTGWTAVLGEGRGSDEVPAIAAPARLHDASGLAPAYIEVGDLDIFRDEDIAYAATLARAGVPVELHVHPGCPHGFERFAPDADVTRRALADRVRVLSSL
ncbi:alpha/beta hydrolase [Streptomyces sp. NPDC026672]|uniref:alpha/beta hydrolase n=1 Tax=unclassified Streptomyces TaxID=2593676 RepID=UPI0033CC71CE